MRAKTLLVAAALLAGFSAFADTPVSGTISTNTTWTLANSPYVVTGNVTVAGAASPVLTIQAGVTVKFNSGMQLLIGSGNPGGIQAIGSSGSPIVFTSSAGSPTRGSWRSVYLASAALASSRLSYVSVLWGGATDAAALVIDGCSPTLDNITVTNSSTDGINVRNVGSNPTISSATSSSHTYAGLSVYVGGTATVSNSTFSSSSNGVYVNDGTTLNATNLTLTNNSVFAFSQASKATLGNVSGLVATGNGTNGIELRAGTVDVSTTWKSVGLSYVVTGNISVAAAASPVLTIQPGVTVKFNSATQLLIGSGNPGGIQAIGSSGSPIVFTSGAGSPTKGSWRSVYLASRALASSRLSFVSVLWGGPTDSAALVIDGCSPTLDNITVTNSSTDGINVRNVGSNPTISSTTSSSHTYAGLSVYVGGTATVSNSTFSSSSNGVYLNDGTTLNATGLTLTNNSAFALSQNAKTTMGTVSGFVATGNGTNGIELRAGTIDVSTTWRNAGLPYVVTGAVMVMAASAPVLTIEAGTVVKFNAGSGNTCLGIGYGSTPGRLVAIGTASQPILFTSNQTTPTAGFWRGIFLTSASQPASQLSYVTVEAAGYNAYSIQAAVTLDGGTPTLDHLTIRTSSGSGLRVDNGTSTVTYSTITGTTGGDGLGVDFYSPGALTVSDTAITNNAGAPFALRNGASLSGMTNMTITGNGVQAIRYRSQALVTSETWKNFGLPYIPDTYVQVGAASTPVLTIEAGVVVEFNAGSTNTCFAIGYGSTPGRLVAIGTPSQPIRFTSNQVTPTAGYWRGVFLTSTSQPSSQLAYVTVEAAGYNAYSIQAALSLEAGAPTVDHVSMVTSSGTGLRVVGGTPSVTNSTISATTGSGATGMTVSGGNISVTGSTISGTTGTGVVVKTGGILTLGNSSIVGNTAGYTNQVPTSPQNATLSYWGAASGPSGSGSGTGQSVSTGVLYEPWLTATPSIGQFFTSFSQTNRSFNPTIGVNSILNFTTSLTGNWTVQIMTSGGTVIRTIAGSGASGAATWDGKNDGGVLQANGTYTYQLSSVSGGQSATPAVGFAIIDTTLQAGFTGLSVSQAYFSPNGDGVQDTVALTGTATPGGATWTVNVRNSLNAIVRTYTGSAPTLSVIWDGKNGSGTIQPDGSYTFEAIATYGTSSATSTLGTTLDNTLPTATLTAPTPTQVISNVYQNGLTSFGVTGTASDTNITSWTLDYGAGSAPTTWATIGTGTTSVTNGPLGTWTTVALANGTYTVRLRVWDRAGNLRTTTVVVTVGNFSLTQNTLQINAPASETITYTSVVPFTLTETITLKNEAGQAVRTLFSGLRAAGAYNDAWDGKGGSGQFLPSGGYFVVANLSAGGSNAMWDQSTQYLNDLSTHYLGESQSGTYDPLNNQPLVLTYTSSQPSRIAVIVAPQSVGEITDSCSLPQMCLVYNRYEEMGAHSVSWAGVDSAGSSHPEMNQMVVVSRRTLFPKNAVVVYGTRPSVTNVFATPRVVSAGTLNLTLDLATFQNVTSSITVTFLNQTSLTVLRTITVPTQAPGHVTIPWDTRADNGMLVAPGRYVITASGVDSLGNSIFFQTLAEVLY